MFRNVAGQKVTLFAFDSTTNLPKTGDAANLTAYVSKDDGAVTVLGDTSATELDSTNAKGCYTFDLTQGESNADKALFTGKSSTANITVVPLLLYTLPPSFTSHVAQTGDGYAIVASLTHGNAALKTLIDAIGVKTANLPSDPADQSLVEAAITASQTALEARTLTAALIAKLTAHLGGVLTGLVGSGSTTTTLVLNSLSGINSSAPSSVNDFYNGRVIIFLTGALANQATSISDYVGSTVTMTIIGVTSAPQVGDTFIVI